MNGWFEVSAVCDCCGLEMRSQVKLGPGKTTFKNISDTLLQSGHQLERERLHELGHNV